MQCTNFSLEARCWHIMAHIGAVIKIWLDKGGEQNIIYFFRTSRQICYRKLTIIPRDDLPICLFFTLSLTSSLSLVLFILFLLVTAGLEAELSWCFDWLFSFQAHCFSQNCCSISISSKSYYYKKCTDITSLLKCTTASERDETEVGR